jgi:IS605 OrfB family transposase
MLLAHRIRLDPTPAQRDYFARAAGSARRVWNRALAEWPRQAAAGQRPNAMALKRQFNAIKYTHPDWLGAGARIARARKDFLHKPTAHLCRENQTVVIEDLDVKDMLANGRSARAIADVGLCEFRRQLRYKAQRYGTTAVLADRRCLSRHDRDLNAAINLRRLATGALAAQSALPVASPAATPGTAAGMGSAAGGKVTPVRDEHGQQDGSGQEENRAHF